MNPDFDALIKNYDVLLFTETKTDNFDVLKIPCDYDVHFKNRKKLKNKSGGIVVIYKTYFSNYSKFLDSDSDFVHWIEISMYVEIIIISESLSFTNNIFSFLLLIVSYCSKASIVSNLVFGRVGIFFRRSLYNDSDAL